MSSHNKCSCVFPAVEEVSSLAKCSALRELDISHTGVADVHAICQSLLLRRLNLSHTALTDTQPIGLCTSLRQLDLSVTEVRTFIDTDHIPAHFLHIVAAHTFHHRLCTSISPLSTGVLCLPCDYRARHSCHRSPFTILCTAGGGHRTSRPVHNPIHSQSSRHGGHKG